MSVQRTKSAQESLAIHFIFKITQSFLPKYQQFYHLSNRASEVYYFFFFLLLSNLNFL